MINLIKNNSAYRFGAIYIVVITIVSAILNLLTWHATIPNQMVYIGIMIFSFIFWLLYYVPLYKFINEEHWDHESFGVVFNKRTIIVSLVLIAFIVYKIGINAIILEHWVQLTIEGFARVSEEFFYRGFIFMFLLKVFNDKKHPWIYAVVGSSFLFAIMHTQTFLPGNNLTMLTLFINSILLGLSRHYTKSILPAVLFHAASNGGIIAMISAIIFYILLLNIIQWMYRRFSIYKLD